MLNSVTRRKAFSFLTAGILSLSLAACGGSGDAGGESAGNAASYETYETAYNKISENGGIDADIDVALTMDGTSNDYSGNFKLDSVNNIMYYEMTSSGQTTTQFSDGQYLYIERDGQTIKQVISGGSSQTTDMPSQQGGQPQQGDPQGQEAPEFDSSKYLDEFSSFLDAGKIKEMGLLEAVPSAAVSGVTEQNGVYTLAISDTLAEKFINNMATEQAGSDTVQVKDMQNFSYKATIENGIVTGTEYSGSVTVQVPASLSNDGKDEDYALEFDIKISFNNPGEAVEVTLPSDLSSYTEAKR